MTNFSFSNSEHLKSRKAIAGLFSDGQSAKGFPLRFQYNLRQIEVSDEVHMKVGFVVTKRNFNKAVHRNRIKRQMKEIFRLNRANLNDALKDKNMHLDMMVIFVNSTSSTYQHIERYAKRNRKIMQRTIKNTIQISIIQIICFLFFINTTSAQKYVQLEIFNSANVKKYAPGDRLVFKSQEFPDNWQKQTILKINYEAELIHFKRGYIEIKDITQVRVFLPVPYALSRMLYLFGGVSLIYGGIGDAFQGQLQQQTIIFSAGPIALAFFLDKVVSYKKYTMGKTARLRVLDLSMF